MSPSVLPESRAGLIGAIVSIAMAAAVCATQAFAQTPVRITEYGIYSKDHKLLEQTNTIPEGAEVRFGFCFEADIDFHDAGSYMLVEALQHPPVGSGDGAPNVGYSVPRMFKVRDGIAYGCSGYHARDASDLRPGVWKFTISDGPEDLVVKEFTVK